MLSTPASPAIALVGSIVKLTVAVAAGFAFFQAVERRFLNHPVTFRRAPQQPIGASPEPAFTTSADAR